MASMHRMDLNHAVHVLSCMNGECKPHVDRLVQLLEDRGATCVSQARGDYGLGGLFTTRFSHFFKSCGITIIHICEENIEKVKEFEQLMRDDAERMCFIRLPCSPSATSEFIKQFNVWDLSEENVSKRFIDEILKELDPSPHFREEAVERPIPVSLENSYRVKTRVFKPVSFIHRGAEYPVLNVDESFLLPSSAEDKIRRKIQECAHSYTFVNFSEENPDVLFFVLNEVIPDLYNQGQITLLAMLTRCQQPLLRDRALRYIQLLLLLNRDQTLYSVYDLKKTEILLFGLFTVMQQHDDALVSKLVTYLITLVSYIMSCHSQGNDAECDSHLNVIMRRNLFQDARFKYSKKKSGTRTTEDLIKVLQKCVQSWQRRKCKELNSKITSSFIKAEEPATKDLKVLLLVSSLIQLHKDGNVDSYSHRFSQMDQENSTSDSLPNPYEFLFANISIVGLTTFLEHRTTNLEASSSVLQDCKQAIKILSISLRTLDVNDRPQLLRQLTTLYFHHNNEIRKQSSKLYSKEDKIITMTHILWENLLLTSEDLLSPLMKNAITEYSFSFHLHCGWKEIKYDFSGEGNRVLMHVLCRSTQEHQEGVRCDLEDDRFNELRLLKDLQHPHIVQLQAYSESVWPQFYITEDYMIGALQSLLVNKSRKSDFYPLEQLVMFLVDAIEGVQYLHSNNIVHRHLTAAHLFISTSGKVKVSGLMHARKLSEDTLLDFKCSLIPTRWSAPESLKHCVFSKMSDMWMVGHLLYEVLTHGRLPYADEGPDDDEVIPLVVNGSRALFQEECIPRPVQNLISQLTNLEPSSRLSKTKVVISELQSLVKQTNKDIKSVRFPDLQEEGQAATEHRKGPVASVLNTYFGSSDVIWKLVGTKYHGPVEGLMHIREFCPVDFSSSALSHLTSCHVPGISPLISEPRIVSKERRELSFWLPFEHSACSLANVVSVMWLGRDIKEYIQCLVDIATAIADLHSYGLVLCDFCAERIYIEKDPTAPGQRIKVWFGSLANIRILHPYADNEDHHIKLSPPKLFQMYRSRAAPEVVKDGIYSHASDVFCFGKLMWWVINTFCETKAEGSVPRSYSRIYHKIEDCESFVKEKPPGFPRHIYNLIKWCCWPDRCKRLPIHAVQQLLSSSNKDPLRVDIGQTSTDKYNNTSDSSGFHSSYQSNTESEIGSNESVYFRRHPEQKSITCRASEPPPIAPRLRRTSSSTPPSVQEQNASMSTLPPIPQPRTIKPTRHSSSPPSPPQLPRSQNKSLTLPHSMVPPSWSNMPNTSISHSLSEANLPSPHPRPPKKVLTNFLPSSAPDQQVTNKPQESPTSSSSLQTLSNLSSHQLTPSFNIDDPDSSSWPGAFPVINKQNLERKWTSDTDVSGNSARIMRRKTRNKSDSIKEFTYDVVDSSCDNIYDVGKRSGATVRLQTSSNPSMKSFFIQGTRGQIQEALRIITLHTRQKEEILDKTQAVWLEWIRKAFPDLERRAIFIPPVSITPVPMVKKTFAGHNVLMLRQENIEDNFAAQDLKHVSTQRSDVLGDKAVQHVMYSFKIFSKIHREIFVCLSQLTFGSYLGNPSFFPATSHLPLPSNLPETLPISWRQGDFDVLLIHRQYGFVICEVKATIYNAETSEKERSKQIIRKLNDAKKQLDKAEAMLSHLVSDVAPDLRITKTIVCPNLTSLEIQEIISANPQVQQDLFQCFKLRKSTDVSRMIISSDHLCDPESWKDTNDEKTKKLIEWWKAFVAESGSDTCKDTCPDVYRNLIARFCGPASTVTIPCITEPRVSIKTMGHAVSHVGDCYTANIILFPEQIELLHRAPLRAFLVGPPGTGKTTVLLLMASEWLFHGNDVYVLSTWESSVSATLMLHHLLQQMLTTNLANVPTPGQVFIKILDGTYDIILALEDLTNAASKGSLHIIVDEAGPDHGPESRVFQEFCTQLLDRFQNNNAVLHLWAASCFHKQAPAPQDRQEGWELQSFTRPLRCPPSVIQEIKKAVEIKNHTVQEYSERGVPDFTDGPPVHWVTHQRQQHSSKNVEDCNICGKVVAKFLHDELLLGVSLTSDTTPSGTFSSFSCSRTPEGLKYKDVLILSLLELCEDDPILKALSNANIPVQVMTDQDMEDVATAESDVVWAARQHLVRGLERKIVVCLVNNTDEKNPYAFTRLFAMSRCTSQLIVVCSAS